MPTVSSAVKSASPVESAPSPPSGARFDEVDAAEPRLKFHLYGDGLPTGRTAKVRSMNGRGERALMDSMSARGPAAVDHLVRFFLQTVEELDGAPPTEGQLLDLHDADVRALKLRIRKATHGDSSLVEFAWDCAPPAVPAGLGCGHRGSGPASANGIPPNRHAIDLLELDFLPMAEPKPIKLPKSGRIAGFYPSTLRRQKAYAATARRAKDSIDLDALFLVRGLELDGKAARQGDLDAMEGQDRSFLRRAMLRREGVDSLVTATCNDCGFVLKTVVEAVPGFFFPEMEEA